MRVFLVDGTYELFRQFFGRPSHLTKDGQEVGALRGAIGSTLQLLEDGATHVGVATDHVIESFRNQMYEHYKTGAGIDQTLHSQFIPFETGLELLGVTCWPSVELEADDALATAAAIAAEDERVKQVAILTPDKDLAQCVIGNRVVQVDRRKNLVLDEDAIIAKYGVPPESIPDYLALVGDAADGYPGIAGFGAKGTAAVLRQYKRIEDIPADGAAWNCNVRGGGALAVKLREQMDDALLFKALATLRIDRTIMTGVDQLEWRGPSPEFSKWCEEFELGRAAERADAAWQKFNQ